jgi:hypothetical protein
MYWYTIKWSAVLTDIILGEKKPEVGFLFLLRRLDASS